MYRISFALALVGALLLIIAISAPLLFPTLFQYQINKKLIIAPGTQMEKSFKETPVPIYFQIWFFNLTNSNDVIDGHRPILQQVGPYTYRQRRFRVNVQWKKETGTVRFRSKKLYYFEPDLSVGSESDKITSINPVYTTLASKVSSNNVPDAVRSVTQLWFLRFGNKPFMTHPVGELLFRGYDEPLLGELFKLTNDPVHQKAKSGWFPSKNATIGDEIEIFTGELGMSNYQHIFKYRQTEKLDYWKENRCNIINGTDGAQFALPINKSEPLFLFTADLCRSIYAIFEKEVQLGPLTLNRFILPRSLLEFSDENKCFCSSDFTCKSGMIDVSPCRKGAPVVMSTPHFYQGDLTAQLAVEGLNPLKEEHETFIDVEPNTGVAMRVAKRIQLNMPLKRYAQFPTLAKVPEVVIPILWVNESVVVPMDRVEKLHKTLTLAPQLVMYGSWVLLGLGLLLILIAFSLTCSTYRKNSKLQKRRQQLSDKRKGGNDIKLMDKKLSLVS